MRVRGLHPVSVVASASAAIAIRPRLRLRTRHGRMTIPPPKDENDQQQDEGGEADPSRKLMRHRERGIQLAADQVANRDDERAPDDRAEHVPSEELEERHPARTRHRARHETHAGDESRHEDGLAAMGPKEKLEAVVARAHDREHDGKALEHALSAGAADDVAAAVADDGAEDYDEVDEAEIEQELAGEEARGEHHGFFGHGHAEVADEDGDEDTEIAPRREQVGDVRGVGYAVHWRSICREAVVIACPIRRASVRGRWLIKC